MIAVRIARFWTRVGDPLGPTDVDPDDARDRACDVTSSSRLCDVASPPDPDRPPNDSFDPSDGGAIGGVLGWLLIIVLATVLIIAIAWIAKQWMDGSDGSTADDDDPSGDLDESLDDVVDARVVDHETPPERWRRLAADARDGGDHREAVRCQYRALVGDLARAGYVDEIPGRTSGEERRQVAEIAPHLGAGDDVAHHFAVAADTFDSAWFDDEPVTADDDERFVAAERAVLDVVLTGSARRATRRSAAT